MNISGCTYDTAGDMGGTLGLGYWAYGLLWLAFCCRYHVLLKLVSRRHQLASQYLSIHTNYETLNLGDPWIPIHGKRDNGSKLPRSRSARSTMELMDGIYGWCDVKITMTDVL